jgi:hypothetical protein
MCVLNVNFTKLQKVETDSLGLNLCTNRPIGDQIVSVLSSAPTPRYRKAGSSVVYLCGFAKFCRRIRVLSSDHRYL